MGLLEALNDYLPQVLPVKELLDQCVSMYKEEDTISSELAQKTGTQKRAPPFYIL